MGRDATNDLTQLLTAEGFDEIARLSRNRHWFTYLPRLSYEQERQAILQWLLTPNEGHEQGDFFIKRLLAAALEAAPDPSQFDPSEANQSAPSFPRSAAERMDYLNRSYSSAVVAQELRARGSEEDNRYIDLLLVDPVNALILLIERKDGSTVHDNQLRQYYTSMTEQAYTTGSREHGQQPEGGYTVLPILLDSHGGDHHAGQKGYAQLDDRWLIEALAECLEREDLDPVLRWNFATLLNYVFGEEWDEAREAYFAGWSRRFNQFSAQHGALLRHLFQTDARHPSTESGPDLTLTQAGFHELVHRIVRMPPPRATQSSLLAHARYYDTLWELSGYNRLVALAATIHARADDVYAHTYYRNHTPVLEATCDSRWGEHKASEATRWPYWLSIEPASTQTDDGAAESQQRFTVRIGASRACKDSLPQEAERFARRVNAEPELPTFQAFEGKDWTNRRATVEPNLLILSTGQGTRLATILEHFERIARSAS